MDSVISRTKARRLLGEKYDPRKTDAELTEMLHAMGHSVSVKKDPSPPEQVSVAHVTSGSPATDKLSVLRAKQLAGETVDPAEYEALRQEVIEGSDAKAHVLWLYLERTYDCEVCELVRERHGIFGFKIRTPKGTFLDYATRKELFHALDEMGLRRR